MNLPMEEMVNNMSMENAECIYYCMAAAVDNKVLAIPYRIAEWDNALGLYGPEDKAYIQKRSKTIYVANCKKVVARHGDYKRTGTVY